MNQSVEYHRVKLRIGCMGEYFVNLLCEGHLASVVVLLNDFEQYFEVWRASCGI